MPTPVLPSRALYLTAPGGWNIYLRLEMFQYEWGIAVESSYQELVEACDRGWLPAEDLVEGELFFAWPALNHIKDK